MAFLLGCQAPTADSPADPQDPADTDPAASPQWDFDWSEDGWANDVSVDDMADGIQYVVDLVPSFDGLSATGAYEAAMENHDPSDNCPKYYEGSAGPFWSDECTDSQGNEYFGQVTTHENFDSYVSQYMIQPFFDLYGPIYDEDYDVDDWSGRIEQNYGISGGGTINSPTNFFGFGGYFFYVNVRNQGLEMWNHDVKGSIDWTGSAPEGSWLALGLVPWLTVSHIRPAGGDHHREVNGSISNLPGDINTVEFFDVRIVAESLGSSCSLEPSGQIAIRSNAPYWYTVEFDGPAAHDEVTPPELCDGCGTAWYGDVELGQVCVDFSPLLMKYESTGGGGL
jgi:hypothetical protein